MNIKIMLLISCLLNQCLLASESKCWKIIFFEDYWTNWQQKQPTSHEIYATILHEAFQKADSFVPEDEKDKARWVKEQVKYFKTICDEKEKERELTKCQEGMKRANSWWAQIAPTSLKAHFFVEGFIQEYKNRNP